jgi:hypothetical protein
MKWRSLKLLIEKTQDVFPIENVGNDDVGKNDDVGNCYGTINRITAGRAPGLHLVVVPSGVEFRDVRHHEGRVSDGFPWRWFFRFLQLLFKNLMDMFGIY